MDPGKWVNERTGFPERTHLRPQVDLGARLKKLEPYFDKLDKLDPDTLRKVHELMGKLAELKKRNASQAGYLEFVKRVWPAFIEGTHHGLMAEAFEKVIQGNLRRLIINMPPRHTKSEFASYLLPAWFLGNNPTGKVIQTAHTAELAVGFGRKVRNLVSSDEYQEVFPGVDLQIDSKAAGRWNTNQGGEYFAIGVGGAVTGKGADLLVIDDPHSEQEGQSLDPSVFDRVYEWYTSGPRQRLQPGGSIVIVMTRWHKRDLTGQILKSSINRKGMDEWEVIELPAILPSGNALWPEYWAVEELERLRAELPVPKWSAQYQQDPTSEEGAIIKRDSWKRWDKPEAPECDFVIQSWDTAFLKTQRSDYSACTTWGVFHRESDVDGLKHTNVILLDAFKERMEFPELKERAYKEWQHWQPDAFIVEGKSSGMPLVFELRQRGIPVQEFVPSRGNDKVVRVNSIADLFSSGIVWAPETRFAEEVIEEFASFPTGDHDDLVDSGTQALIRFRKGGFLPLASDDDEDTNAYRGKVSFY